MTYHRVCNQINTTGATSGAGTAYPSGAPEFTPIFSGVRVTRSLILCVWFEDRCLSFCTFSVATVLSVLRYTDSDYPFDIFKLFFIHTIYLLHEHHVAEETTVYRECHIEYRIMTVLKVETDIITSHQYHSGSDSNAVFNIVSTI
jgi:hypothetical protein